MSALVKPHCSVHAFDEGLVRAVRVTLQRSLLRIAAFLEVRSGRRLSARSGHACLTQRAESRSSLQARSLTSIQEEADLEHKHRECGAANGSKEPNRPDAAPCMNVCSMKVAHLPFPQSSHRARQDGPASTLCHSITRQQRTTPTRRSETDKGSMASIQTLLRCSP